jgi:hypothetical protein
MGLLDDLLTQYGTPTGSQAPLPSLPPSFQPALYRPTPDATFANLPAATQGQSSVGLPIPQPDPWIWLSPDGSVSYTGRQDAQPAATPVNNNLLSTHAMTLMALGAGVAEGGVGKGLQLATAAAEADRKQEAQRYAVLRSYDALTDAGVPRDEARAAIYDPRVMRAVAAKYFGPKGRSPGATTSVDQAAEPATVDPAR